MRFSRAAAATALAALAVLVPSTGSAAQNQHQLTHYDGWGDVTDFSFDEGTDQTTPVDVPDRVIGDITSLQATYGKSLVRIVVNYRNGGLVRAGISDTHRIVLDTPDPAKNARRIDIVAKPGHWAGQASMDVFHDVEKVHCPAFNYLISYKNHRVVVSFPPSCIGNVPFFKIGATSMFQSNHGIYMDDALTTGNYTFVTYSKGIYRQP